MPTSAPAIAAMTPDELSAANGQILREVVHNDFPTRAKGLAQELLTEKPDLVGLQEVALWRTTPLSACGDADRLRLPAGTAR